MFWYKFNIADWRNGVRGLSRLERSVYRDMLDELYYSEKPLPTLEENLFDLLEVSKSSEMEAVRRVLKKKFVIIDGGWIQRRAWAELSFCEEKRAKNAESGKLGGLAKHQRMLDARLANASERQPDAKRNLASLSNQKPVASNQEPEASSQQPSLPGELAVEDTQGVPELPSGIEFPPGWPSTAEKAVGHVRSLMMPVQPFGPPHEDWVKEVWLQAVGRNFCDGAQVRIVQFAHWVHGRWSKEGQEWLARREASKPREKKEGALFPPMVIKEPEWPWRKVVFAEWGYVPLAPWERQTARKRREIESAWARMPAERRAEVEAMVLPEPESGDGQGQPDGDRA